RSPVRERSEARRPAPDGVGGKRVVFRLRRPAHPRKPASQVWGGGGTPDVRPPRRLSRGDGHRKTDAHGSRAAPHGAVNPGGILPLFLWHSRFHSHGDGAPGAK